MKFVRRTWKALAGLLGAVAAPQIDWVTNEIFAVDLPHAVDTGIAAIIGYVIVYTFPANREPTSTARVEESL